LRRAFVLLMLMVAGCSREPPPDPAIAVEVRNFDLAEYHLEQGVRQLSATASDDERDFRGVTIAQDLDQWVLTRNTRDEIHGLREQARQSRSLADARQALARAASLQSDDTKRAAAISSYWRGHLPAPYWRRYWQALFEANGVSVDAPDSLLVSIEGRMKASLAKGDFDAAGNQADELVSVFAESRDRAAERIRHASGATPAYRARKTPCEKPASRERGDNRARLIHGEAVESFYPADALRRGEEGSVVLQARIDRYGCATDVAILVHSGVRSLDEAALSWFESARFSPATRNSVPIESELAWKIRFVLKE
jgi:TonB family protein